MLVFKPSPLSSSGIGANLLTFLKPKMRLTLVRILFLTCPLLLYGCRELKSADAEKSPVDKCLGGLHKLPEVAALAKARNRSNGEGSEHGLAGMQIALTINGMIRGQSDPEEEIDSWCVSENTRENFHKILEALKRNDMPPTVDFVTGRRIDEALLVDWLKSGNLLGNMTFHRVKARKRTAQEFIKDIQLNDQALSKLWAKFPPKQKYFRYPRLKLSRESANRESIWAYLKQAGYVEVPATIDARDRKFNEVYCGAQSRGDDACVNLIRAQFKSLLLSTFLNARSSAKSRAGYDVKHILMIGANQFTCDSLGEILSYFKSLGVLFIPLEDALKDPLYSIVDDKGKAAGRGIIRDTRKAQVAGSPK
jgi:peptidoglycan/xylan/chitin deacetylase (PgdA/CDA1 family)